MNANYLNLNDSFLQKTKKKVANGLQIFMIFVIFLPIPLFIPSFFISVKQQHNHNSQYPEKRSSLYPFPDQLVSISPAKRWTYKSLTARRRKPSIWWISVCLVKHFENQAIFKNIKLRFTFIIQRFWDLCHFTKKTFWDICRFRYLCSILITVQIYDIQKENI